MIAKLIKMAIFIICAEMLADLCSKKTYFRFIKLLMNLCILAMTIDLILGVGVIFDEGLWW